MRAKDNDFLNLLSWNFYDTKRQISRRDLAEFLTSSPTTQFGAVATGRAQSQDRRVKDEQQFRLPKVSFNRLMILTGSKRWSKVADQQNKRRPIDHWFRFAFDIAAVVLLAPIVVAILLEENQNR